MRDISVTRFAFGDEQLFSIGDHVDSSLCGPTTLVVVGELLSD